MEPIPQNYPGPNAQGVPRNEIPYYAYGHDAGNEPLTQPGPWAAGSVPAASNNAFNPGPLPPGAWGRFIFDDIPAGQTTYAWFYNYVGNGVSFVDWGDGTIDQLADDEYVEHVYATSGRKVITYTGDGSGCGEVEVYYDLAEGGWLGPNSIELIAPALESLWIDNFPYYLALDCPVVYFVYLGSPQSSASFGYAYIKSIFDACPEICSGYGALDIDGGTPRGSFDLSADSVNSLLMANPKSPYDLIKVGADTHVFRLYSCTVTILDVSSTDFFWGNATVSSLKNVLCNDSGYSTMEYLLRTCADSDVNNGTFTGTGNGVPYGQAATDVTTLTGRGWTVTTD